MVRTYTVTEREEIYTKMLDILNDFKQKKTSIWLCWALALVLEELYPGEMDYSEYQETIKEFPELYIHRKPEKQMWWPVHDIDTRITVVQGALIEVKHAIL